MIQLRRALLFATAAIQLLSAPGFAGEPLRLIAHRGGIVGDEFAENSAAALQAAIERGYWMIEVDIRESKDGKLVVQHDPNFKRFYGHAGTVAEMTWSEISRLRATPGQTTPLQFHELAALCKGNLRLMLDTKEPDHSPAFYQSMLEALEKNDLLGSTYVIGTDESRMFFRGKARVGLPAMALKQAAAQGEEVSKLYFLFEHGRDLDDETVAWAQHLGVPVVPSINIFHYADLPDHFKAAHADIVRLQQRGITEFQIDSVYDRWLRK
jgi:glycerophosphoryl diester phosphodiesterase